ncbi:MAG TPA: hypothetical protein PJ986_01060 [Gammaproteobacteria bacterium]|nr:hypothetical protein [Gammaproteobacteria bacterium]
MDIRTANERSLSPRGRPWRRPFAGTLVALLLLAGVESALHTDFFLYRYRSVFAAGRAMDKLLALEAEPTPVLAVGNSRVDNGIHPEIFLRETGQRVFNLGLPGAEACNVEGVIERLIERELIGPGRIEQVLFGLDDGFFQRVGGLGYEVFFDARERLLAHDRYRDWLRSILRLWGYSDSLRTLQEPAKLIRFAQATLGEVESWGGNARDTRGFRAADAAMNQDEAQARIQDAAAIKPPDPEVLECFWAATERLQRAGAGITIVFMPTLKDRNPFVAANGAPESPYGRVRKMLEEADIRVLHIDIDGLQTARYFANAGHLNREGAERFTTLVSARFAAAVVRHDGSVVARAND